MLFTADSLNGTVATRGDAAPFSEAPRDARGFPSPVLTAAPVPRRQHLVISKQLPGHWRRGMLTVHEARPSYKELPAGRLS